MTQSIFFRLLKTPIDDKGEALAAQIAGLNQSGEADEVFTLDPADFAYIPGSPFAYWVGDSIRQLFTKLPPVEAEGRAVRLGDHPDNQDRYIRVFWEVPPSTRSETRQWIPYQKGGEYSPYYSDVHLRVDWDLERETYYDFHGRPGRSSEHPSNYYYFFRSGLTWSRRTQKGLNLRPMPEGCIFADKGPVAFAPGDDPDTLLALLAVMNSLPFQMLVELQMAFGSYEVGVIQRTPIPRFTHHASRFTLSALAREAHDLQRDGDRTDETTHAFCLPGLARHRDKSLWEGSLALEAEAGAAQARLTAIQAEIDEVVFDLYGLDAADRALIRRETGADEAFTDYALRTTDHASRITGPQEDLEDNEAPSPPEDLPDHVQNLLIWCAGVAFGRWDVRFALDPGLLPALQGPFDPLPRCAPGALVGPDGLPARPSAIASDDWLRARENVLDLPAIDDFRLTADESGQPPTANRKSSIVNQEIAWDGILVDDPTHPADIVTRVRGVLSLLWGEQAGAVEGKACQILGFKSLRDNFRDPRRGFFAFHSKRYSKSRRKAPIYWPLQSERRGYTLWLYYHRLTPATLFVAGRDYADAKVALEKARLDELQAGLESHAGAARRRREREIERQGNLVAEVTAFRDRLDAVALLNLKPDLNDGVLINIAPLWELVPWREAQRTWEKLVTGEYGWSSMARQMRERGLVKRKT
jgi:hypothetical protein